MFRRLIHDALGSISWRVLRCHYRMDDRTAIIMLPETNIEWNAVAMRYLPNYLNRKKANNAIVFSEQKDSIAHEIPKIEEIPIRFERISNARIRLLMDYYCLHRFSDKIVFFYLNYPKDNCSSKVLKETDVTMDELVCLGFYRLREVPSHV